ncbi:molybdate ABC transporter permease subunit, partial [Thermodesulfatator autotrophicus]
MFSPLWLSFKLAGIVTVILIILACPLAYILVFKNFRAKPWVESFIMLPLVLPPTVLGSALLMLLGPYSPIGKLSLKLFGDTPAFHFSGLVLACLLHGLPFAVQPLKAAMNKLDHKILELAEVSGLSPLNTFFKIVLPNVWSGIMAAAIITIVFRQLCPQ